MKEIINSDLTKNINLDISRTNEDIDTSQFHLDKKRFIRALNKYSEIHALKNQIKELERKVTADFSKIQGYDPYKLAEALKNFFESIFKGLLAGVYLRFVLKGRKTSQELAFAQDTFQYVTQDDPKAYINLIKSNLSDNDLRVIDIFKKFTQGGIENLSKQDLHFIYTLQKDIEMQPQIAEKERKLLFDISQLIRPTIKPRIQRNI